MRGRVARLLIVLLLLGIAAGVVWHVRQISIDAARAADRQADLETRIDALLELITEIGTAQAGYFAPGDMPEAWPEGLPSVLLQLSASTVAIGATLESEAGARALDRLADATAMFAQSDALTRDHLLLGDPEEAASVLFGDGRGALGSMRAALADIRRSEAATRAAAQAAASHDAWTIAAVAGGVWVLGLVALALLPASRRHQPTSSPAHAIDVPGAADLFTAIARADTTESLAGALDRAVALLDASGLAVWMGHGDQLIIAAAHGYDASEKRRRIIGRHEDHATAEAWRVGELRSVRGNSTANGLIAAPMFSPGGCCGVLVVEVRDGREDDPPTRALVVMLAAQLASVVSGTPHVDTRATGT